MQWPASAFDWQRTLLTDPQTSGGLLVSCDAAAAEAVLGTFRSAGFDSAAVVGVVEAMEAGQGSRIACV